MQQHYSAEQEQAYRNNEFYQQREKGVPLQDAPYVTFFSNAASASQRLGLAITSLAALVLISMAVVGFLTHDGSTPLDWAALVLACVMIVTLSAAVTAINFIFNYRH